MLNSFEFPLSVFTLRRREAERNSEIQLNSRTSLRNINNIFRSSLWRKANLITHKGIKIYNGYKFFLVISSFVTWFLKFLIQKYTPNVLTHKKTFHSSFFPIFLCLFYELNSTGGVYFELKYLQLYLVLRESVN